MTRIHRQPIIRITLAFTLVAGLCVEAVGKTSRANRKTSLTQEGHGGPPHERNRIDQEWTPKILQPNDFPLPVWMHFYSLVRKFKEEGISHSIKESSDQIVLEEHGFDIFDRFIAKKYIDTHTDFNTRRTATLELNDDGKVFKIFSSDDDVEKYTVDTNPIYRPFYLGKSKGGYRFISIDDIGCSSLKCEELPVDLDDAWGLFSLTSEGGLISKTGDPSHTLLRVNGRPKDLGREWAFKHPTRTIILPKEKPLTALKEAEFVTIEGTEGRRRFAKQDNLYENTPEFVGTPVDYGKSLLLDLGDGDGFQLVAKKDFTDKSLLMIKPPTFEDGRDYVTIQTEDHQYVVQLDSPNFPSPPFDEVVWKNDHLWVVSEQRFNQAPTYAIFSPNKPYLFWGPYTTQPKLESETVKIKSPEPTYAPMHGNLILGPTTGPLLLEDAQGKEHRLSMEPK